MMNKQANPRVFLALLLAILAFVLAAGVVFAEGDVTPEAVDVTFTGPIQEKGPIPGEWVIGEHTVQVTERTRFHPAPEEMQVGDIVRVAAFPREGKLWAVAIVKPGPRPVHFRGKIERMEESLWIVGGRRVIITPETEIGGDPPDVGDIAAVWGHAGDEGVVAKRILVKDAQPRPVRFRGKVLAIEDGVWKIDTAEGERTVHVNEDTRIVGDPGVGDWVGVKGVLLDDGSVLAHLIVKLEPDQNRTKFAGFVAEILPTPAVVPGEVVWLVKLPAYGQHSEQSWVVHVTADTEINVPPESVEVGDWVKGFGTEQEDGSVLAKLVRVTRPPRVSFHGEVTEIPDPTSTGFPKGWWTIGGVHVLVDEQTEIRGDIPQLGEQAAGWGELLPDGGVHARLLVGHPHPTQP
ncbi:MAG: hypothetical protein D6775_13340 [Caldilineae bacterium]|nr:MAG: hypothetical protein D6775_13340 [Caldilineae bacterium]